jgi:hypothetical protein
LAVAPLQLTLMTGCVIRFHKLFKKKNEE